MTRNKIPTGPSTGSGHGLRSTGETIALPLPLYNSLLEIAPMTTPVIPLYEIRNPLDNRICCGYARRDDVAGAASCEMLMNGGAGCLLGDGRPCLFDEPDDSPMWRWVREQRRIEEELK